MYIGQDYNTAMPASQYGEEKIILPFFHGQRGGYVVDVGAADGQTFSNSRVLIRDYDWRGLLIEPEPTHYAALEALYAGSGYVRTTRRAVDTTTGDGRMWPMPLGSTLIPEWRDRILRIHPQLSFGEPITVQTEPLADLLAEAEAPVLIDFLSVDCEGMDLVVLQTMDWRTYTVRLVCIEEAGYGLDDYMASVGFEFYTRTHGNQFWRRRRDAA
jgi:FkbM family methyltransferase